MSRSAAGLHSACAHCGVRPNHASSTSSLGMTAVMGQEARIVEEQGSFRVMWLVGADGSAAGIDVFPGSTPLTVDGVLSIAAGIVQFTQAEWLALGDNSPTAPAVTIP